MLRTTRQNKISQKNREKLSNFNTMENSINLKLDQNSNNLINKFDPRFSSFEKEILSKTDNLRQVNARQISFFLIKMIENRLLLLLLNYYFIVKVSTR